MDKILDKKRMYIGYDGEDYIDLSIPVVNINKIKGNTIVRVNSDENARLDSFVWRNSTKDLNMIDMVMYANHIFNPFSVKEGDLLYVPIDSDKVFDDSEEPYLPDGTKHSNNTNGEKNMSYAEKVAYLARNGFGKK